MCQMGKLHEQEDYSRLLQEREAELNSADTETGERFFRAERWGRGGLMDNPGFENSLYPKEKYSLSTF